MKTFIANVKSPVGVWSVVGTEAGVTHIHLPQDELPASKGEAPKPVADSVDRPRAHRAVGNANHANPWPIVVPCHRVVAAAGLGGYGGGDDVKRYLLDLEGVYYD